MLSELRTGGVDDVLFAINELDVDDDMFVLPLVCRVVFEMTYHRDVLAEVFDRHGELCRRNGGIYDTYSSTPSVGEQMRCGVALCIISHLSEPS